MNGNGLSDLVIDLDCGFFVIRALESSVKELNQFPDFLLEKKPGTTPCRGSHLPSCRAV